MTLRMLGLAVGVAFATGCHATSTRMEPQTSAVIGPTITAVRPDSGPAGTAYPIEVTIEGRGFADSSNVVTFGPVTVRNIASREAGTRIVLLLPKEIPSPGEVPPSPLTPGKYDLRVTTPSGVSNTMTFRLIESVP